MKHMVESVSRYTVNCCYFVKFQLNFKQTELCIVGKLDFYYCKWLNFTLEHLIYDLSLTFLWSYSLVHIKSYYNCYYLGWIELRVVGHMFLFFNTQKYTYHNTTFTKNSHFICHFLCCQWKEMYQYCTCAELEQVAFKLQFWTGTDLSCVITSLLVWGEISCNTILKYTLGVWEMFLQCHNLGFLQTKDSTSENRNVNWSKWPSWKYEWEVTHVYLCLLSVSPPVLMSLTFCEGTQILLIPQVVISSLLIDVSC